MRQLLARLGPAVVALLLVAALGATAPAEAASPLRVAVLDFTNAAPDPAWDALGKGLQSMVTTDIAELASGRDDLQVVERARLVDLQNELNLGKSGALDPKTAARIGKLAGATHLVAGSFTVVGAKMRLDARLITVQNGEVTMTANAEGDKDAFFELEKDLVKRLVDGAGVKMAPKERAKLAEIHTSDLEAFRAYSEGIAQFDAKKYDAALKNLEKASRLDDSFDLAKRTLAEYERLATDARGHADAAAAAEAERARLLAAQAAGWDQVMLDRITKVQDTTKDPFERAMATSLLIEIFDPDNSMNGHFGAVRAGTDPFVLERLSDRFAQRYVQDAKPLAPKVPLYPFQTLWGVHGFPKDAAREWDAWWKELRKVAQNEDQDTLNIAYAGSHLAKRLHLDNREEIDLVERAMRALDAQTDPERKVSLRRGLAEDLLKVGLTDRAAKVLTEIRQYTQDAKTLDEVADWLGWGRDLHAELAKQDALAPWRKEFFVLNYSWPPIHGLKDAQAAFVGDALSEKALKALNHLRQWSATYPGEDYHWVGDTLVWPLAESRAEVLSGPSSDRLRHASFRYFWDKLGVAEEAFFMAAFGETQTKAPTLALSLDYRRAADWYDSGAKRVEDDVRPKLTVLFGMRDILSDKSPLQAFGVRLDGEKAELVKVSRARGARKVAVEVLGSGKLGFGGGKSTLELSVGADVTVKIGGKSQRLSLPSGTSGLDGFTGVLIEGAGYVEVGDIRLTP